MKYLDLVDLQAVGAAALDGPMQVGDWGLMESAVARPRTTVFGQDAYPTVWDKAASLVHSLVRNHALVDGNKQLGFTAAVLLLYRNGVEVAFEEDEAYDLVIAVAEGRVDVREIAQSLQRWGQ